MRHAPRRIITEIVVTGIVLGISTAAWAAPPPAPSGLQVGGFPGARIRVAWTDNAADETGFQLERSAGDRSGYVLLSTLPANTTVYTDATPALDTTYWYRVRACNADGCSATSLCR